MPKIRIMIVDDHEVVRVGMRTVLEAETDLAVVGEAANGADALAKIAVLAPQLILMDVRMEKMDGIEACRPTGRAPTIEFRSHVDSIPCAGRVPGFDWPPARPGRIAPAH